MRSSRRLAQAGWAESIARGTHGSTAPSRSRFCQRSSPRVQFGSSASSEKPKTISKLNHPRICVLHDVGHQDGIDGGGHAE